MLSPTSWSVACREFIDKAAGMFNESSTVASENCLNKHVRIGPNLLPALADILLRWRAHRYVLASDVAKMYRQILIDPADRHVQQILWRDNEQDRVTEYVLNTVTYGLAPRFWRYALCDSSQTTRRRTFLKDQSFCARTFT